MVWKKVGGKEVDGSPTAVSFLTPQDVPDREKNPNKLWKEL